MKKVITYVDYGRGPNWDVVAEEKLGIKLDGKTPIYFARAGDGLNDESVFLMSNEPFNPKEEKDSQCI